MLESAKTSPPISYFILYKNTTDTCIMYCGFFDFYGYQICISLYI